mmetsp:Transcript_43704/g.138167  ORF Transcript_43704/g.138167 Transcript_43704/m.138167 type:complete len:200 (-) Transcript_43704:432-1031(-)
MPMRRSPPSFLLFQPSSLLRTEMFLPSTSIERCTTSKRTMVLSTRTSVSCSRSITSSIPRGPGLSESSWESCPPATTSCSAPSSSTPSTPRDCSTGLRHGMLSSGRRLCIRSKRRSATATSDTSQPSLSSPFSPPTRCSWWAQASSTTCATSTPTTIVRASPTESSRETSSSSRLSRSPSSSCCMRQPSPTTSPTSRSP